MSNVTAVIPTTNENVITLESIPKEIPTEVVREGSLNEARNIGVERADTEKIVLMDDDIKFTEEFFWDLVEKIEDRRLVGRPDWDYGLVAGRTMGFTKTTWDRVGGFDERLGSHMGDTEFSLKFTIRGYEIEHIDKDRIEHEPHSRSVTTWDRIWRTAYLSVNYPTFAYPLIRKTVL